jgi:spore coat protein U-like protein
MAAIARSWPFLARTYRGELMLVRLLPVSLLLPFACAFGETLTDSVDITATIQNGCTIGTSGSTTSAQFGTIDFGTMSSLTSQVDAISTVGSGSIVVTCTPGIAITIGLNNGVNNTGSQRYIIHSGGTTKLAYELYRTASYNTIWGSGAQALSIASFPVTQQTYTVYARLFASGTQPPAGTYTDTITVTLTY